MTVYGELSQPLVDLLKAHAAGFTWFTFVQGLEAYPASLSRIPEVAGGAEPV
jgi:hypothetical protein